MGESPSHKFGQIIGDVLEDAVKLLLQDFASEYSLYLDKKGPRKARKGNKVSWKDLNGNWHDLDFVLERGGSENVIGEPVAFIETAWRRYTKHSRNKAQEIQGAILPLAATYKNNTPFTGTILAGVFTIGALSQLSSLGFTVLFFSYENVLVSFQAVGIDASFDEHTPDSVFTEKVRQWEMLSSDRKKTVAKGLVKTNIPETERFIHTLRAMISRTIELVRLLPLHGIQIEFNSIQEAANYLEGYIIDKGDYPLTRIEVEIRYSNGDILNNMFADKELAIKFLNTYFGGFTA